MRAARPILFAALTLLGASCGGCAACSPPAAKPDAGVPAPPPKPKPARIQRSTDLRTAVLLVYPEWRGVEVRSGSAVLRRYLSGADDWNKVARDAFAYSHFAPDADGGLTATQGQMKLALEKPGVFTVSVALSDRTISGVMQAAAPMGTTIMGQYMPRGPNLKTEREEFDFDLTYAESSKGRVAYVAWQMVSLLRNSQQWQVVELPRGFPQTTTIGKAPKLVPEKFRAEMKSLADGATVVMERDGGTATVHYHLVTNEPAK